MCHPERRRNAPKSKDLKRGGGGIPLPSALPYRHARGNRGCHPEWSLSFWSAAIESRRSRYTKLGYL